MHTIRQIHLRELIGLLLTGGLSVLPFRTALATRQTLESPSRIHLVFEPRPVDGVVKPAALATIVQVLERRLDDSGIRDASARDSAGRVIVEASGVRELGRLEGLLTRSGRLEFRITDMHHRFRDVLPMIDRTLEPPAVQERPGAPPSADGISQLFGQGASGTTSGPLSAVLFVGQLPGEFLVPEEQVSFAESLLALPQVIVPEGIELWWGAALASRGGHAYRALYALEARPILTGRDIRDATARRDLTSRHSVVVFHLTGHGATRFCDATGRHVHDYLAIGLDGRVLSQPPIINDRICGEAGQIDLQNAPLADARDLASLMTSGPLPVPLALVDELVLDASSADRSGLALLTAVASFGLIGLALLLLFAGRRKATPKG